MTMSELTRQPLLVFLLSFVLLWISAWLGASVLRQRRPLVEGAREDYTMIVGATLTLLGLIIGFSFSMAISRYDQRKNLEEEEANAIGTEFVRADLLPSADAAKVKGLLKEYLELRIAFYTLPFSAPLQKVNERTAHLQNELWTAVRTPAVAQQTAVVALAVNGMNDVLNSQGYTQAAWWNRIPVAAWGLMFAIAVCSNLLVGYGTRNVKAESPLLVVLPLVFAIAFLLIADIDSPRGGIIRVVPQNLTSLLDSLHAP